MTRTTEAWARKMGEKAKFSPQRGVWVACLAAGCSSSAPASVPRVFTGQVAGTDARLAVVATTHRARVYFCGGNSSYSTMTQWFTVDIDGAGAIVSSSDAGGSVSFEGTLIDTDVHGSVTAIGGQTHDFTATPVSAGTLAGLYEAEGPCGKLGVIVAQSSPSSVAIAQGACIGAAGAGGVARVEQVTPLLPIARAANGTIRVTVAGGSTPASVAPAAAPAE